MENFKKLNSEIANNVINFAGAMPRSLVIVNNVTGSVYNVTAKCRVSDAVAIAKCLAKAILAVERERQATNSTEAAIASGKRVVSPLSSALGCQSVHLTDKDGHLIENVCLSVKGKTKINGRPMSLRDVFRFTKSQEIYKLVVEQGKDWADPAVVKALGVWCQAAIEQMDWLDRADVAIAAAAESTEKEQKAAEKAEKDAKKAAKSEEKSEEKKAAA